jgi:hypothetical protein
MPGIYPHRQRAGNSDLADDDPTVAAGSEAPLILNYRASTVPIVHVALSGDGLTEHNLADIGINQLRTPLVNVPGAAIRRAHRGQSLLRRNDGLRPATAGIGLLPSERRKKVP